jgi:hypothetical protein
MCKKSAKRDTARNPRNIVTSLAAKRASRLPNTARILLQSRLGRVSSVKFIKVWWHDATLLFIFQIL